MRLYENFHAEKVMTEARNLIEVRKDLFAPIESDGISYGFLSLGEAMATALRAIEIADQRIREISG